MQQALRGFMSVAALVGLLSMSGCIGNGDNNGSSSGSSGSTTTDASATGIWTGTDSATGLGIVGYVNNAGDAVFMRADGAQFSGPTQISGNTLVAAVIGYADFGNSFSDGSTYGLGTLNGTVTTGTSLTLTLSFTTNDGTAQSGSWSLTFSSLSDNTSTLSTVSANYTDSTGGWAISINGDGVMSGQNSGNSCVLNGSVTVSDSSYDVYQVAFTYEDCTGTYAVLNGVQFTGLAAFNPGSSPAALTIAVSGASSTSKYALVLDLGVS